MWRNIFPIILIVLSNTVYNIMTKSTPPEANAFLSLTVTYTVAAVLSFCLFFFQDGHRLSAELPRLNWTAVGLGICIVGLEIGYIFAYRAGWKVNICSLVANITLAAVLLGVGFALYGESLSLRQLAGVLICVFGLTLMAK